MNIALIIAGGIGLRTGCDTPKQFIKIKGKPIIVYTLERFERHKEIDLICVVCLPGWEERLREYSDYYHIRKLQIIALGGNTGFESIQNGLAEIEKYGISPSDNILIHDAIRPLISEEIITENIKVCNQYGNAITYIPIAEALLEKKGAILSTTSLDRDFVVRTQTPQSGKYGELKKFYTMAKDKNISNSTTLSTLITSLGFACYLSKGSEENIKITTHDDLTLFSNLLDIYQNKISLYKQKCVEGNKFLKNHSLCILTWGNFSCRIPNTNLFCIKPSGVDYDMLTEDSIVVMDLDGHIIEGNLSPSVDTPTHLEIYKKHPNITSIVHTHSTYATVFSQALTPVPILGTTHADFYNHEIPVTRIFTDEEIQKYEYYSGVIISEILQEYSNLPAILVANHAPFAFGYKEIFESCKNALILEEICKNAFMTMQLNPKNPMPSSLIQMAYKRKNGKNAYYGQKNNE